MLYLHIYDSIYNRLTIINNKQTYNDVLPSQAQLAATIIAVFGFNGYTNPRDPISPCQFCLMDTTGLSTNPFFSSGEVPAYGSESEFEASCIGAIGYALVSWIWAIIFHFGLDPLKWLMAYMINDDGFRDRAAFNKTRTRPAVLDQRSATEEATVPGAWRGCCADGSRVGAVQCCIVSPPQAWWAPPTATRWVACPLCAHRRKWTSTVHPCWSVARRCPPK